MGLKRRPIKLLKGPGRQHRLDGAPAPAAQAATPDARINTCPSANCSAPCRPPWQLHRATDEDEGAWERNRQLEHQPKAEASCVGLLREAAIDGSIRHAVAVFPTRADVAVIAFEFLVFAGEPGLLKLAAKARAAQLQNAPTRWPTCRRFDYQLDRHCSKTERVKVNPDKRTQSIFCSSHEK